MTNVNQYGWKALVGSAVGYAMDGFDLLILGFMLSAISADLNLTPAQSGSLVTWTLIGAVVGGIVFGALSDRYNCIWCIKRSLRTCTRTDLDHRTLCCIHRFMCNRTRLLGFINLSHHRGYRFGR